jgi:hypothetical protein
MSTPETTENENHLPIRFDGGDGANDRLPQGTIIRRGGAAAQGRVGMNKPDREKLRALMTRKVLWKLVATAKTRTDPVTWRAEGGPEAEDFLDALESGRSHPLLLQWKQLKGTVAANRSAPDQLDQIARRNVVLMCVALYRAGLKPKTAVRKLAAKAVKDVFPESPTVDAIRHWWDAYPPFAPEDEALIMSAIKRHGRDHARIAGWFAGLVRYANDPTTARTATPVTR